MAEFNILDHWDALTPDGGSNDPKGDHSFLCPACEAPNFKVHIRTGKWSTYSCDCASTESGKRRIRDALSPAVNPNPVPTAKPRRPKQKRHWDYFTPITLQQRQPAITVNRWDDPDQPDGNGWKNGRKINQTQRVAKGKVPYQEVASKVQPYRLHDALQALADGAPYVFWPEGEPCCDALWALDLPAITNIGGSGKFIPDRDGPAATGIPADRLVVVPDRDQPGLKHAEQVAAAYPGCQWLFPFPGAPEWNGACPTSGGLDIADWIAHGITADQILAAIGQPAAPAAITPAAPNTIDDLLGPCENGKLRRPRTDHLTQVMALALPLRFNLLTQRIENDGQPIDGDFLGTLYLQLAERFQIEVAKDRACDAAILQARRNAFHPVRDYLAGITTQLPPEQWKAIAHHIFNTADPVAGTHFRRQLIGLVARAIQPGCKLDTALVVHSSQQGIGKSTMWAILGGSWFSDSLGDLRNLKDDVLQLHSAWIHEWGEIDAVVGKRESETLKKFLSATRDDVRKPYGRGVETLVRSCGIVGTTNRSDFIKDPTGNRRFPVISVTQVNTDWVQANRNAIWGSALAAFNEGTSWHYDNAENSAISKAAQNYAAEDPLRDQIETWMDDNPDTTAAAMPAIVFHLNRDRQRDQEFSRQVAIRLTALGWVKSNRRERGFLPDGTRHDKATIWELPALPHLPEPLPHPLPHPTAHQSQTDFFPF